jgi:hypothetical protein
MVGTGLVEVSLVNFGGDEDNDENPQEDPRNDIDVESGSWPLAREQVSKHIRPDQVNVQHLSPCLFFFSF